MAGTSKPSGYSGLQIGLHWAVAMLVVIQFLGHDGIEHAWDAVSDGATAATSSTVLLHVGAGASIFVLSLWRLWLRLTRGAPPLPEKEPAPLRFVASATHILFYVLLIGMPMSGSLAWFAGIEQAAAAHGLATNVLLALLALHVAGAFFQQFVLKTQVLTRMAVPQD
jgi:cytochrome b561